MVVKDESKPPVSQGYLRLIMGKNVYSIFRDKPQPAAEIFKRTGLLWLGERFIYLKNDDHTNRPPFKLVLDGLTYWLYCGKLYKDDDDLTVEEVRALLDAREKVRQQKIKYAKTLAAIETAPELARRGKIPDDVALLVWQRDGGRCSRCGSTTELQYDHIIPVSFGGASMPENLQILCGRCNRTKGASVA